jgi:hypothetical protein
MAVPFSQTVIAVVWDFDKTLIPGNMQAPLFAHFDVDERSFWQEVDALHDWYLAHGAGRVNDDSLYLNMILEYVAAGRMKGLDNALLRELGRDLVFHPGIPQFLRTLQQVVEDEPLYQRADIAVEHYVVSTGLRPMIEGSAVRPFVEDVWACEFIEAHHPPGFLGSEQNQLFPRREITRLAYAIDNTSKTRALFEINKGSNKRPEIHVNSLLPRALRRVPFENMIYIADGPSDVPAWSLVQSEGGRTLGVYQHGSRSQFEQISALQRDGRIQALAEADYRTDSTAWLWLTTEVRRIADRIVEEREAALRTALRPPARHLPEDEPAESEPAAKAAETERQQAAEETLSLRLDDGGPMPSRSSAEVRDSVVDAWPSGDDADAGPPAGVAPGSRSSAASD